MAQHAGPPDNTDNFIDYERGPWPQTIASHRHYMIGRLMRQKLYSPEMGGREELKCKCHGEVVKVFGSSITESQYRAYCSVDGERVGQSPTMEGLWADVAGVSEIRAAQQ